MKFTKPVVIAVGSVNMAKCGSKPCGRPCDKRSG